MQPEATGVQPQPRRVDLVFRGHLHNGLGGSRPPRGPDLYIDVGQTITMVCCVIKTTEPTCSLISHRAFWARQNIPWLSIQYFPGSLLTFTSLWTLNFSLNFWFRFLKWLESKYYCKFLCRQHQLLHTGRWPFSSPYSSSWQEPCIRLDSHALISGGKNKSTQ